MNPNPFISGIHHLTIGVDGSKEHTDFMTRVLGLRLIKQELFLGLDERNCHMHYGSQNAGTVITTFIKQGKEITKTENAIRIGFSVPLDSLEFWAERFSKNQIFISDISTRFGQRRIEFSDPSGIQMCLLENDIDNRKPYIQADIPEDKGIKGIYSVGINSIYPGMKDLYLQEVLGLDKIGEESGIHRFHINQGGPERVIEIYQRPENEYNSHEKPEDFPAHIAFSAVSSGINLKEYIANMGYDIVSEIADNEDFHSFYAQIPGGPLLEFANPDFGLSIDDPADTLYHQKFLPAFSGEIRRIEYSIYP